MKKLYCTVFSCLQSNKKIGTLGHTCICPDSLLRGKVESVEDRGEGWEGSIDPADVMEISDSWTTE